MKKGQENQEPVVIWLSEDEEGMDLNSLFEESKATDTMPNLDLSLGLPYDFFDFNVLGNQTERREERGVDFGQSSKRRRQNEHTVEARGKAIIIDLDDDDDDDNHSNFQFSSMAVGERREEVVVTEDFLKLDLTVSTEKNSNDIANPIPMDIDYAPAKPEENFFHHTTEAKRQYRHDIAKEFALRFARSNQEQPQEKNKIIVELGEEGLENSQNPTPFSMALEMIKKRTEKNKRGAFRQEHIINWVPCSSSARGGLNKDCIPSLLDLSLDVLAKNADKIESLELIPDELRHKLSHSVSNYRKMDGRFVELLARGSPKEIRVKDCSYLKEQDLSAIFIQFDAKELTLLQLDLCGHCLSDYGLRDIIVQSSGILPSLVTISLRGAYRLSDTGLKLLALSAPALRSINLSQSSLLTSDGINDLARCLKFTLRELYIDDCQSIDAMRILPALKELKNLEVLSVADIPTVCDDFVIELVEGCGIHIKELVLAKCGALTDRSLQAVGKTCSELCAIDLSFLTNLTDSAIQFLANGCRSIRRLTLCRNDFSDEAIAAFLESSGQSLSELSLNNVKQVGPQTALSLAKCSRNLLSLDLSWCRKLTDEAFGLIVDSCSSLRLLKVFGCSQITNFFIDGHSNSILRIVGLKMQPVVAHLDLLEPRPQHCY